MGKGWNRNRGWNNGWGSNRKNRNGAWDLTWANLTEIVTDEKVQRGLIAGRERKTEGLVPEMIGEGTMTGTTTVRVVVIVDRGNQVLIWTPSLSEPQLGDWFRGLSGEAVENLWTNPRSLPGRVEQIALAASGASTHVMNIWCKDKISLVEMKEGSPDEGTLLFKDYRSDQSSG